MEIPLVAYGTWVANVAEIPDIVPQVKTAIQLGYPHIDTAKNYGTEPYVIQAIVESGIPRDSIFLTSKLILPIAPSILQTNIGTLQYYDLLLLHAPPFHTGSRAQFKEKILSIWIDMNSYLHTGITKAIGVSNFYQNHLDILLEVCAENSLIHPVVNQIEMHPGNLELQYVPYMQSRRIAPFAHTPLGGLASQYVLNNEVLIEIGTRLGASVAQVILAYLLRRRIGVITASKNPIHMADSLQSPRFSNQLTETDIMAIDATDAGVGPFIELAQIAWEDNMTLY